MIEHGIIQLDPSIHRSRVQNRHFGAETSGPIDRHSEDLAVIRGYGSPGITLALDAEHHHGVDGIKNRIEIMGDSDSAVRSRKKVCQTPRNERGRTDKQYLRSEFLKSVDVRTRDPTVQNIADDRDTSALERSQSRSQGGRIEQGLRGVLVTTITGIDDRNVQPLVEMPCTAGSRRAHHDHLGAHGRQILRGIKQGFALARTRSPAGQSHRTMTEPMHGGFKAPSSPGRILHEQKTDHGGNGLDRSRPGLSVDERKKPFGLIENGGDVISAKAAKAKKRSGLAHGQNPTAPGKSHPGESTNSIEPGRFAAEDSVRETGRRSDQHAFRQQFDRD